MVAHLKELSGVGDDAPDREAKLREFCRKFAERAFRRPLSDEQKTIFIDRQFKDVPDLETAVKRVGLADAQVAAVSLPRNEPRPA